MFFLQAHFLQLFNISLNSDWAKLDRWISQMNSTVPQASSAPSEISSGISAWKWNMDLVPCFKFTDILAKSSLLPKRSPGAILFNYWTLQNRNSSTLSWKANFNFTNKTVQKNPEPQTKNVTVSLIKGHCLVYKYYIDHICLCAYKSNEKICKI